MRCTGQLFLQICRVCPHSECIQRVFYHPKIAINVIFLQSIPSQRRDRPCFLLFKAEYNLFGVLAQYHSAFWRHFIRRFGVFHNLPSTPKPWSRATANQAARTPAPPSTAAKRPMTERETPHEDFKTPHDQTANAPCPKQNAA